jgi:hypothetical protein
VTKQGVLVFRNDEQTTYIHGVFSNNHINLYHTESTNYTGFSRIIATAKFWAAPIDVFLLHRQEWACNVSQDRRMFRIFPSDCRVSFFGILVSNIQHRREKIFFGLPLQEKQNFIHYFSCDVPFWKVRALADLTLWHAFITKYQLGHQQDLQP